MADPKIPGMMPAIPAGMTAALGTLPDTPAGHAQMLETFLDQAGVLAFARDLEGRYVFVNDAFLVRTGRRAEDVLGRTDVELWPQRAEVLLQDDDAAREGPVQSEVTVFLGGIPTKFLLRRFPLRGLRDELVGIAGVGTDITEWKQADAELALSAARLAEAQALAHLGSFRWEVAANAVTWTDELHRIYGLDPGEFVPTFEQYLARVHDDDRERVQSAVQHTLATGEPFEHEYRVVRPSGEIRNVFARGRSVSDDHGTLVALHGICHDITERKEVEAQRARLEADVRRTGQLESLGRLAASVAHDFNNVLAVIMNYASFVARRVEDPVLRDDMDRIVDAVKQATGLTSQLQAFGRDSQAEPAPLDLNAVIQSLGPMLRTAVGEHVQVRVALCPGDAIVEIDPGQLQQALVNLTVNARDAMPDGGTLSLSTRRVVLDGAGGGPRGAYVCLEVGDDGVGMPPEVVEHVFEPFFTTKGRAGTGLGLATVYAIVGRVGGLVTVDSEPGLGTTLSLLFPASDAQPEPELPEEDEPPGGSEAIVVVDDQEAVVEGVRRTLVASGYQVSAFSRPEDVVSYVAGGGAIDLLLTDVLMPGMSGLTLAGELQAHAPGTRVLLMSGHLASSAGGDTESAAYPRMAKPFTEETLLRRVRAVLDHG